ncbi:MAG: ABC transporter substrate-binding protein [Planctomycetota bacterium]|jgi:ABC-type branched-subunit amino acid transport system substrate-binding protein|nr:ABC transporter substrate-binding protein [Planctomycetota bacterium]MDP6764085.1 ABC transporter substrate-binding protein [Planctomycetota bacterium]MDP6989801.1 ABC transporter substrate-binding protein [Planctomycetota bacterium]
MTETPIARALFPFVLASLAACSGGEAGAGAAAAGGPRRGPGVEPGSKVLSIGCLNDVSGPGAAIGVPYALGKRVLAAQINAGGSGLLPEGWKVELVERDHGYNPQNAVQAYREIRDEVLFLGHSFGTPNTLPLLDLLEADTMVAFPASLSSEMAKNASTPPIGPSYRLEAARAMDWAVEQAGGAAEVKAGIVYQHDDYGKDGLGGWLDQAALHGVEVVGEQTVAPGQKDMTAVITALKEAGATHVLLTTIPSATGPILGTAAQLDYAPVWIGNTPSWIDAFFRPDVIPSSVFDRFYWTTGLPFWNEPVEGMETFMAAWEAHGADQGEPDFYVMMSYLQGLTGIEAFRRGLEADDVSREGFLSALQGITEFTGGGMLQPVSYAASPYVAGTRTRILRPDFETGSWSVVAPYAEKANTGG